ncbi:hypothetical protein MBLNU459_g3792t1 [Dothideomycetes sp. NU459]
MNVAVFEVDLVAVLVVNEDGNLGLDADVVKADTVEPMMLVCDLVSDAADVGRSVRKDIVVEVCATGFVVAYDQAVTSDGVPAEIAGTGYSLGALFEGIELSPGKAVEGNVSEKADSVVSTNGIDRFRVSGTVAGRPVLSCVVQESAEVVFGASATYVVRVLILVTVTTSRENRIAAPAIWPARRMEMIGLVYMVIRNERS